MLKTILLTVTLAATALVSARAETILALTSGNRLLAFDSETPGTITRTIVVAGLADDEVLRAIDFRPYTGGLYGLGSSSRIYVIDTNTGAATAVGTAGAFTLNGTRFGFDFNPVVDRIRITSDTDQNLRVNPGNGALVETDTQLQYAGSDPNAAQNPNIVGSAYTNSFGGALATTLYDIDSETDTLVIQNPPNAGTLNTVGSLGTDVTSQVGFDISPTTGVAYASFYAPPSVDATTDGLAFTGALYTIDLANGGATVVGTIGGAADIGGETIIDIAAPAVTRLLNVSTRGRVGDGENILIGGFILRGFNTGRFLIRGLGPSVTGVGTKLADPVLTLFDSNGNALQTNDDWQTPPNEAQITGTGIPPNDPKEAAILAELLPGNYTAQVTSKDGTPGIALVEVYQLP